MQDNKKIKKLKNGFTTIISASIESLNRLRKIAKRSKILKKEMHWRGILEKIMEWLRKRGGIKI